MASYLDHQVQVKYIVFWVTKETVEVLQHLFLCQEGAYKSFPDNNCITLMIFSHLVRAFTSPVGKTIFKTWQGPDNTEEKTTLGCLSSIHLVSLSYMQAHTQTHTNTQEHTHTQAHTHNLPLTIRATHAPRLTFSWKRLQQFFSPSKTNLLVDHLSSDKKWRITVLNEWRQFRQCDIFPPTHWPNATFSSTRAPFSVFILF